MEGRDGSHPATTNPFSSTAAARIAGSDAVTVMTPAIRSATVELEAYLQSIRSGPRPAGTAGDVMAVIGDHGTGKTHLAAHLLHRARELVGTTGYTGFLEAPGAGGFVALYRRFVADLPRADVRERIRDYYADVVADAMDESSSITADIANRLRAGELDPVGIVQGFGLTDSVLIRTLRDRLSGITDNESFGTALSLLLRPEFETEVWNWFLGFPPHAILVERGIAEAVDNDDAALEVLGVFAMLYARRQRPLVLVIDELNKLMPEAPGERENALIAFHKMLAVFAEANAFLVISVLPEFMEQLSSDLIDRIGHKVAMSVLDGPAVQRFIEESQERVGGVRQLSPFSVDTAAYIAAIGDGSPRRIVRLCHDCYRRWAEAGGEIDGEIDEAMVREAARSQIDIPTLDVARNKVRRTLHNQGYGFRQDYVVGQLGMPPVDFWITVDDSTGGCAVILVEAVLSHDDVVELKQHIAQIRAVSQDNEVLMVLLGNRLPAYAADLQELLRAEPISYDRRSFEDDLAAAVKAVVSGLLNLADDEGLGLVRSRVDRIGRQQSHTQESVEALATQVEGMQTATQDRMSAIQQELRSLSESLLQLVAPEAATPLPTRPNLPPETAEIFAGALAQLGDVERVDPVLAQAFAPVQRSGQAPNPLVAVQARLRRREVYSALGVAVFLQKLVAAFRDAIALWHESLPAGAAVTVADRERLDDVCRAYDSAYGFVPRVPMTDLRDLTEPATGAERPSSAHRADQFAIFDDLGTTVRRTVISELAAGRIA